MTALGFFPVGTDVIKEAVDVTDLNCILLAADILHKRPFTKENVKKMEQLALLYIKRLGEIQPRKDLYSPFQKDGIEKLQNYVELGQFCLDPYRDSAAGCPLWNKNLNLNPAKAAGLDVILLDTAVKQSIDALSHGRGESAFVAQNYRKALDLARQSPETDPQKIEVLELGLKRADQARVLFDNAVANFENFKRENLLDPAFIVNHKYIPINERIVVEPVCKSDSSSDSSQPVLPSSAAESSGVATESSQVSRKRKQPSSSKDQPDPSPSPAESPSLPTGSSKVSRKRKHSSGSIPLEPNAESQPVSAFSTSLTDPAQKKRIEPESISDPKDPRFDTFISTFTTPSSSSTAAKAKAAAKTAAKTAVRTVPSFLAIGLSRFAAFVKRW